jgi:septal ring-binding cell division protein DamX
VTRETAAQAQVLESIDQLRRRMARLLLVQSDTMPDAGGLAREVDALERRLTGYIDLAEHWLSSLEPPSVPPEDGDASAADEGERRGHGDDSAEHSRRVEALRVDVEQITAALDAFVECPDHAACLADFNDRLRAAEQRLDALVGKPPAAFSAAANVAPLRPDGLGGHPFAEGRSTPPTGVSQPSQSAVPRREPVWWQAPRDIGHVEALEAEVAALGRRVVRLESRLRVSLVLMLILSALMAVALWMLQPLGALQGGNQISISQLPKAEPDEVPGEQIPPTPVVALTDHVPEDLAIAADQESATPPAQIAARSPEAPAESEPGTGDIIATAESVTESGYEGGKQVADTVVNSEVSIEAAPETEATEQGASASESAPVAAEETSSEAQEKAASAETGEGAAPAADAETAAKVLETERYGIQLIAFRDQVSMLDYARGADLVGDAFYTHSSSSGVGWYVLVKGFFATRGEAQAAAERLPAALSKLDPWVRSFPAGTAFYRID